MFAAGLSVKQQLEELEAALGLDYGDQDWGIVNADASRVAEFASFFEQRHNEHWSPWTVAEFVDLVLESASDAIGGGARFNASCIDAFVSLAAPLAPERLAYWSSHAFEVAPHLRELGH